MIKIHGAIFAITITHIAGTVTTRLSLHITTITIAHIIRITIRSIMATITQMHWQPSIPPNTQVMQHQGHLGQPAKGHLGQPVQGHPGQPIQGQPVHGQPETQQKKEARANTANPATVKIRMNGEYSDCRIISKSLEVNHQ